MADTSPRKARQTFDSGLTDIEKNKSGASIAQGNEVAGASYNVARSEDITFSNAEDFNQSTQDYFEDASTIYNESEFLLKAIENKKARLAYTVTFASNKYTLTAKSSTISKLVANGVEQEFQDKTVYNAPTIIANGFNTRFIAAATNTGSTDIDIQQYDGTFTTFTLKKYNNVGFLVNLIAGDILINTEVQIVMIAGQMVVFSLASQIATLQQKKNSIISSPIGANGRPSYIAKINETTIAFNISPANPLVVCFPSGDIRTITALTGVTNMTGNAFYRIFIEKDNIQALSDDYNGAVCNTYTQPTAPTGTIPNNSYWWDNQGKDVVTYKQVGGAWVQTDVVQLGFFNRTGGIIGTIYHHNWFNADNDGNVKCDLRQAYVIANAMTITNAISTPIFKAPSNGSIIIWGQNLFRGGAELFWGNTPSTITNGYGQFGDDINSSTKAFPPAEYTAIRDVYYQVRFSQVGATIITDDFSALSMIFYPKANY